MSWLRCELRLFIIPRLAAAFARWLSGHGLAGHTLCGMVSHAPAMPLAFLPIPPSNGFHVGPLFVHFYGLMYVIGIALAVYITRRRWIAAGGYGPLVADVATWAVPAGTLG